MNDKVGIFLFNILNITSVEVELYTKFNFVLIRCLT